MLTIYCVPVRQIRKGVKSTRPVDVTFDPNRDIEGASPLMTIDEAKYKVKESIFDAEFGIGRAFQIEKLDPKKPESYSVFVACDSNGPANYCDCIGFSKGGYCKHIDTLGYLIKHAIIDEPKPIECEEPEADMDEFWEQFNQQELVQKEIEWEGSENCVSAL